MMAILYIILAWLSGTLLLKWTIGPFSFLNVPENPLRLAGLWAAGLWVGLLPATLATYGLAALSAALFRQTYPLLLPNTLYFALLSLMLIWIALPRLKSIVTGQNPRQLIGQLTHRRSLPAGSSLVFGLILASGGFASLMMWRSFFIEQNQLAAGYSIFSDFAPHVALVRSFAVGWNWPTGYPHFAGDGIHYHFLFYFFCGNLNYLGLPIDWAINLPSVLAFVSVVILLALLARAITSRLLAAALAPFLFFFRSSLALPLEWIRQWQLDVSASAGDSVIARISRVFRSIWELDHFIGSTPHDDWGLWTLNVFLNQRHFLSGLAVLILLILLLLPDLKKPSARRRTPILGYLRSPATLLNEAKAALKALHARQLIAFILWICLPFWHGSILVSSLLILLVWWLFLNRRLGWTLGGILAAASALLQINWFAGSSGSGSAVNPHLLGGFIASDQSFAGVLLYLLLVTGFALPLGLIMALDLGRLPRLMLAASAILILFLFSFSLTVDVTANHKYLMIALLFVSIPLAGGLARLLTHRTLSSKLLAIFLAFTLTCTGLYETRLIDTINRNHLDMTIDSPLVTWIMENTPPRSVFLTAPYHYHAFFYTGRQSYYGHAYYAWSAGHDTAYRDFLVRTLFASTEETWSDSLTIIQNEKIDYLLVDDDLRFHSDLELNEAFFQDHFPILAVFPEQGNSVIYDLRKWSDHP